MDIKQLQTFKTIVELNSFTKAASRLGYAQSSITAHIQMIEDELGTPVFERLGKTIAVTSAGRQLYDYTIELLSIYSKIKSISAGSQDIKGDLRLGSSETFTVYRLGTILFKYKEKFPNVNITLINDNCEQLKKRLFTGELDIAFTLEPKVKEQDLELTVLTEEPLVFVKSHNYKSLNIGNEERCKSKEECMIFTEKNCSLRKFFESYLTRNNIAVKSTLVFSSMETIKQCVASGLGISLLPLVSARSLIEDNKVMVMDDYDMNLKLYGQMVYHKDKWISPAMREFINLTIEHLMFED